MANIYHSNRRPFDQLVRFPNPLAIETFISVGDLARDLVASNKIQKVSHEYNVNIKALVQACPSPAQCCVIVFANIDTDTNIDEDIHRKVERYYLGLGRVTSRLLPHGDCPTGVRQLNLQNIHGMMDYVHIWTYLVMECEYVGMEWTYIMNVDMNILHLYFDRDQPFIIVISIISRIYRR